MPWPHTTTLEDPLPLLADLTTCLRFFSRLPVPGGTDGTAMPSLAASIGMLPVAALPIAACTALPLWFGDAAGLPAALSATLGLMAGTLATGALHEDGLADTADGLGGGTPERKLAIMRDSRIGTFGVLALAFSLILRASALATLIGRDGIVATFAAIAGASALSRGLAILPMATLSPARPDGLGRGAGRPARSTLILCFGLAALLGLGLPLATGFGLRHAIVAGVAALVGAAWVTRLAAQQIGGHTGDIAGACQQVAEAAYLVGLLAFGPP